MKLAAFIEALTKAHVRDLPTYGQQLPTYGDDGLRALLPHLALTQESSVIYNVLLVLTISHLNENRIVRPAIAKLLTHASIEVQETALIMVIPHALCGYDEAVNALQTYVDGGKRNQERYLKALGLTPTTARDRRSKYLPVLQK